VIWDDVNELAYLLFKASCVAMRRYFLNRVPAPESVILSFARPKESIQRKSRPIPLASCALTLSLEIAKWGPAPSATRGMPGEAGQALLAAPLRAISNENVSARRGIWDKKLG